jgi:hypothetical protein
MTTLREAGIYALVPLFVSSNPYRILQAPELLRMTA